MLDPNKRSMLTDLLTPPPGMVFDIGLATTFTLDPLTLLGVPLQLAWLASREDQGVLADPIRLLEALQRVTDRLTVFADRGRMHVPGHANALYALLERSIVEVRAPRGGAFHPKLWVLRFAPEGRTRSDDVVLRLGVLSRNLTSDRSWDLSLVLEGRPRGAYITANRPLGELVAQLPSWSVREVAPSQNDHVEQLADEVRRTPWKLPGAWEKVKFHVSGTKRGGWSPGPAKELIVISPFLTVEALAQLRQEATHPLALVSRPATLAALPAAARAAFQRCLVLDDAAETEDGEAPETEDGEAPHRRDTLGLHAKAILLRRGWYTHLFVGSANATNAGMVAGSNVEVMAELVGRHSKVGLVEDLLAQEDFGGVLTDFDPETPVDPVDEARAAAEKALEACQRALSLAELKVICDLHGEGAWRLRLGTAAPIDLGGVAVTAWPLSLSPERGGAAGALAVGAEVELAILDAADVTGLTGFALSIGDHGRGFALNLPVSGLPEDRDAAILRRIIRNREGFLRYLRLLLGGFGLGFEAVDGGGGDSVRAWSTGAGGVEAILEDLVRAWSREPDRLRDVQRVVERLRGAEGEDGPVVPPDFEALWMVFEQALGGGR